MKAALILALGLLAWQVVPAVHAQTPPKVHVKPKQVMPGGIVKVSGTAPTVQNAPSPIGKKMTVILMLPKPVTHFPTVNAAGTYKTKFTIPMGTSPGRIQIRVFLPQVVCRACAPMFANVTVKGTP